VFALRRAPTRAAACYRAPPWATAEGATVPAAIRSTHGSRGDHCDQRGARV